MSSILFGISTFYVYKKKLRDYPVDKEAIQ